jgi:hypothetical protein
VPTPWLLSEVLAGLLISLIRAKAKDAAGSSRSLYIRRYRSGDSITSIRNLGNQRRQRREAPRKGRRFRIHQPSQADRRREQPRQLSSCHKPSRTAASEDHSRQEQTGLADASQAGRFMNRKAYRGASTHLPFPDSYRWEIGRGYGIYPAVNCLTFPAHALCFPPSFCLRLLISALASRNSAASKPSVNWS